MTWPLFWMPCRSATMVSTRRLPHLGSRARARLCRGFYHCRSGTKLRPDPPGSSPEPTGDSGLQIRHAPGAGKHGCGKRLGAAVSLRRLAQHQHARHAALGPDSGYDSIGDFEIARPLARLLDSLEGQISAWQKHLVCAQSRDNDLVAAMIGNFQDGSVAGKLQFGSAWWFNDQKEGIERQINALSNMGLLSRFRGHAH